MLGKYNLILLIGMLIVPMALFAQDMGEADSTMEADRKSVV